MLCSRWRELKYVTLLELLLWNKRNRDAILFDGAFCFE